MDRGLSKLQWFILKKASRQSHVHHCEVLHEFFGWETSPRHSSRSGDWNKLRNGNLEEPGRWRFSPAEIGVRRYRSVRASLSRACARLGARGLVTCLIGRYNRSGVEITDQGREFLSVAAVGRPGLEPEPTALVDRDDQGRRLAIGAVGDGVSHAPAASLLHANRIVDDGRVRPSTVPDLADPSIAEQPERFLGRERDGVRAVGPDPAIGLLEEGRAIRTTCIARNTNGRLVPTPAALSAASIQG